MTWFNHDRRRSAYRLIYLGTCATLTALVFFAHLYRPGINGYYRAMFADMVNGTAHRPYVSRTLLPTTVRLLTTAIPAETHTKLNRSLAQWRPMADLIELLNWRQENIVQYLVASALLFACLWGFLRALRSLMLGVYRVSPRVQDAFVLLSLAFLPQFFRYHNYLYDLPALCLFTLGLVLMLRQKWRLFVVVFVAGCLNKETTILLTFVFALHYFDRSRLDRPHYAALLAVQAVIFATVRMGLWLAFRHNPGVLAEWHFHDHNLALLDTYPMHAVFASGGFVLLLLYQWNSKPLFLRHAVWILVPLILSALFFGYLDEVRVLYEAYAIVLLLLMHSIGAIVGFNVLDRNRSITIRDSMQP